MLALWNLVKIYSQIFLLYYLKSAIAFKYVKSASKVGAQEFIGLDGIKSFSNFSSTDI